MFSGRTGHPISVFHGFGPGDYFGISASGGVDIAGGSEPEIVVGAPQGTVVGGVGYAVIFDPILGPPAAWSRIAGTGCGSGLASPSLRVATPALGLSRPIVVSEAAPFSLGILFLSAPPAGISHLPGSCSLALDPATVTPFLAFTTSSSGFWSTTFALPPDPTWAGTRLALQAALYPSLSPLGADLTNGVNIPLFLPSPPRADLPRPSSSGGDPRAARAARRTRWCRHGAAPATPDGPTGRAAHSSRNLLTGPSPCCRLVAGRVPQGGSHEWTHVRCGAVASPRSCNPFRHRRRPLRRTVSCPPRPGTLPCRPGGWGGG